MPISEFFDERQTAAVFKHGLLGRQLYTFASRVGSTAPGGRVVFLDAFAGQGTYTDGSPGSPMLAAITARAAAKIKTTRVVECIYVEKTPRYHEALQSMIEEVPHEGRAILGNIRDVLPDVLQLAGAAPMVGFFDPFGLGLPFAQMSTVLLRSRTLPGGRRTGPPTELILNFSIPGLRRNAGHLTSLSQDAKYLKARPKLVQRVNDTLGSDWWQTIWLSEAADRYNQIAVEYVKRLAEAGGGGWGWGVVPVAKRVGAPPIYYLIFLTQHDAGMWAFLDNLSLTGEQFRAHFEEGQPTLFDAVQEDEWIGHIGDNIQRVLEGSGTFTLGRHLLEIYGTTVGLARSKHIRAAIKTLHERHVTSTTGVGTLTERTVIAASVRTPPGVPR